VLVLHNLEMISRVFSPRSFRSLSTSLEASAAQHQRVIIEDTLLPSQSSMGERHATENSQSSMWRRHNSVFHSISLESAQDIPSGKSNKSVLPEEIANLPMMAVMGRSNSGKSTLLNSIFGKGHKNRAKASSRSGKTTDVDIFTVNGSFALADLPGHSPPDGQLSLAWMKRWGPLVKKFLEHVAPSVRDDNEDLNALVPTLEPSSKMVRPLHGIFFLCDVRWPCSQEDQELLQSIGPEGLNIPTLLVFTKDDRIASDLHRKSKGHRRRRSSSDPEVQAAAINDVHFERIRLAKQRRAELCWSGPHVHFSSGEWKGPQGGWGEGVVTANNPRRSRNHLRRYIETLCNTASVSERHQLLVDAWTHSAGR